MRYLFRGGHPDVLDDGLTLETPGQYIELSDKEAALPNASSMIESGALISAPKKKKGQGDDQ